MVLPFQKIGFIKVNLFNIELHGYNVKIKDSENMCICNLSQQMRNNCPMY